MPVKIANRAKLIKMLNGALAWELRAQALYAHYAAYLKGLEVLTLVEHFEGEVAESIGHAKKVRDMIATLGGEAVSTRDPAPIVHTEDLQTMLTEALKTETKAAATYNKILPIAKSYAPFLHDLSHIMMDEMNAMVEMETLLGR